MAPSRKRKAATAVAAKHQWNIGDLVLAKVKGFPAWPAKVSEPEKSGYKPDKKVHVVFFGTNQIGSCRHADVEAFTEEKKQSLLKRQGKSNDFAAAVREIIDLFDKTKMNNEANSLKICGHDLSPRSDNSVDSLVAVELNDVTESSEAAGKSIGSSHTLKKGSGGLRSRKARNLKEKPLIDKRSASSCSAPSWQLEQRLGNVNNCTGDILHCNSQNGRLTRKTKKIESPETCAFDDPESSAFVSCGSTEDHGSQIVAGDSGACFRMKDVCKMEHSEADVDSLSGDTELLKGLEFGINPVLKRKRKPSRKRPSIEACELQTTHESETDLEVLVRGENKDLFNSIKESDYRWGRSNGDEHLPLVKRARVRMGKLSGFIDCSSPCDRKDMPTVEVPDHVNSVSEVDRLACLPTVARDKLIDSVENSQQLSVISGLTGGLEKCCLPKSNESKTFIFYSDLPPSKRLHRALEAMSANAIEEDNTESVKPTKIELEVSIMSPSTISESKGNNNIVGKDIDSNEQVFSDSASGTIEESKQLPEPEVCTQVEECLTRQQECLDARTNKYEDDHRENEVESFAVSCEIIDSQVENKLGGKSSAGSLKSSPGAVHDDAGSGGRYDSFSSCGECMNLNPQFEEANMCIVNREAAQFSVDDVRDNEKCESTRECQGDQLLHNGDDLTSVSVDLHVKDEKVSEVSPCTRDAIESPRRTSPTDNSQFHISTSESAIDVHHSGCSSPCGFTQCKRNPSGSVADEDKVESVGSRSTKYVEKCDNYAGGQSALIAFEEVLRSLTRTKESISRATRIAIDCAKFGVSSKVMDILIRTLEIESNLPRRVDLFFLVDSITQCSRGLKGDVGVKYPSAVQLALSRLLAAAAPPGNSAKENRRQCLKVLRLWLERKILPESIVRQHMQELESFSESSAGPYARRSARTERSLDDPVRDMEGMLVDEYGSNTSLQLAGICMPRMLKEEDEGSDSDVGFEAVTPEHSPAAFENQKIVPASEKHTCVLEDVDVELEMEDVAPCAAESVSVGTAQGVSDSNPVIPASSSFVSEDRRRSTPPLPPSPPPFLPPPPPLPPNAGDDYVHSDAQRMNNSTSHGTQYNQKEYRDQMQLSYPEPTASSSGNYQMNQDYSHERTNSPRFHHKSYHSMNSFPPSGNYSYMQSGHYGKYRRGNGGSFSRRSWHNSDSGHSFNNHGRMSPASYDFNNWRHRMPRFHGPPPYPENAHYHENSHYVDKELPYHHPPGAYGGPYRDPSRYHHHHDWGYQSQGMHHRN